MYFPNMDPIPIYKSLAEESRLRILNVLQDGPLCVCHVQEALQLPQSKISKQLSYLKKHGLLTSRRHNNWTIYELPNPTPELLEENLELLQNTFGADPFLSDSTRLKNIDTSIACSPAGKTS